MLNAGDKAPDFKLPDQDENEVGLKDYSGKWLVLYFYPKDNTPGCTTEACEFTEDIGSFESLGCDVVGVSPDSAKSHRGFIKKQGLKFRLLSDPDHGMLEAYGAWQEKSMYGKKYMGVQRSTFLIDPQGKVAFAWPNVKVKDHVREVGEKLKELAG